MIDETHDPALKSWVAEADDHPEFPIQNLPLGIFSSPGGAPRPGTAIGDQILDLQEVAALLPDAAARTLSHRTLNALLSLPAADRHALRRALSKLLSSEEHRDIVAAALFPARDCTLHLPAAIGDYSDFYVGIQHATNVGKVFRPDNPLLPNYKYVPIGYHGRASSVRASGADVIRPCGQIKRPDDETPARRPSARLDYELEMGIWIGTGNALGETIPIGDVNAHIAGLCLLNDWSARDLQGWEYQPLGPFLAKSFLTTISPWIVTTEALAPFRVAQPGRPAGDPAPLPYLWDDKDQAEGAFAIDLEVTIATHKMRDASLPPHRLSRGQAAAAMYWTVGQIVTHHASNGCNLNPGDLLGTGTLSMPERDGFGSLLEISRTGPVTLPTGETRMFLEDGDQLSLIGRARREGYRTIGFGPCTGIVQPAPQPAEA